MDVKNIKRPGADELVIIRYLLDELEEEITYNKKYKKAEDDVGELDYTIFPHSPRESIIKDNVKTIRRLLLKIGR